MRSEQVCLPLRRAAKLLVARAVAATFRTSVTWTDLDDPIVSSGVHSLSVRRMAVTRLAWWASLITAFCRYKGSAQF